MLDFHPLTLEDLPRLRQFFGYNSGRICDTTPGAVFIWRDMYKTEWAVYDGSLYFKVSYPGMGETFPLPLGGGRFLALFPGDGHAPSIGPNGPAPARKCVAKVRV